MDKIAASLTNCFQVFRLDGHRGKWDGAGAEPLAQRHQVRDDIFMLASKPAAGSPHSGHYFIENQQYSVFLADLTNKRQISRRGRVHPQSSSANRLRYKGRNRILP